MSPLLRWPMGWVAVAVIALALPVPGAAFEKDRPGKEARGQGEVERPGAGFEQYLPDQTDAVLALNVKPLLDAPAVKKYGPALMKAYWVKFLLLANEDNKGLRKLVEDNPGVFQRDEAGSRKSLATLAEYVNTAVVAISSNGDEFLGIVEGRFDAARVKGLIEWAGDKKFLGLSLKAHQVNGRHLYEFRLPKGEEAVFVAVADEKHLLFSLSKDGIADVLPRGSGNRRPRLNEGLRALLATVDRKQSAWFVVYDAEAEDEEFGGAAGGVRVAADFRVEMTCHTKVAGAAKKLAREAKDELADLGEMLKELAAEQKAFAPLVPVLKGVEVTHKDMAVRVKGQVPAAVLEQVLQALTKGR